MSHNSTAKVDQKEYLKKYLSGDKCKKKKKKKDKKQKTSDTRLRIIDDDATAFQGSGNSEDELLLYSEDAPQIVGEFIETKPNGDAENKWRSIGEKEETNVKEEADDDRWGKKPSTKVKNDKHEIKIKRGTSSDVSPARRRKKSRNLSSEKERANPKPENRKRKSNMSDQSRPRRQKVEADASSPTRNRRNGISPISRQMPGGSKDLSPPRKNKNSISPSRWRTSMDQSPQRRRHETTEQSRQQRISADLSPPRKRKNSISPRRHDNFGDESPPPRDQSPVRRRNDKNDKLRQQRQISRDLSPFRNQRNSLSPRRSEFADQSPFPRRQSSLNQSPPRRRHFTPMKQQKNRFSPNLSPPRKNRYGSVELSTAGGNDSIISRFQKETNKNSPVLSPHRRRRSSTPPTFKRRGTADMSPKRRGISPQRQSEYPRIKRRSSAGFRPRSRSVERARNNTHNPFAEKRVSHDNEFSSPGKRQMSSPRRRDEFARKRSPSREVFRRDLGNKRRDNSLGQREMSNQSSPRRQRRSPRQENRRASPMPPPKTTIHWETAAMVAQRKALNKVSTSMSPPPTHKLKASKTLDGKKAGLQDARALKEETATRRRDEEKMYAKMPSELSGRDAEVQVRSTGRRGRRAQDADEDPEKRRHKEEREQQRKEQYDRWGKGLKQIEDHRARLVDQEYESSKPLARYADDEDLDRHLRERERAEDPMLNYIRRKKKETDKKTNSKTKVPVYEGSYPENRFGIRPGHRWDGVDRSNGYEKKWFDVQNEKRARQEDAYKYSVEDM